MQRSDREKGFDARNTGPLESQTADEFIQEEAMHRKHLASAQARAALIGHELRKVPSGYILSRLSHGKLVADFESVLALLEHVESGKKELQHHG